MVIDNFLPFCALRLPGRWLPYMQYGFTGQCDHIRHAGRTDRDDLVKSWSLCQARLSEMRRKHPHTPPDGFLVFDSAGDEVRRWFEFARPNLRQGPGRR